MTQKKTVYNQTRFPLTQVLPVRELSQDGAMPENLPKVYAYTSYKNSYTPADFTRHTSVDISKAPILKAHVFFWTLNAGEFYLQCYRKSNKE